MVPISLIATLIAQTSPAVSLTVDAREVTRGLFRVAERFAAKPGKLTLWFPRWIPGWHMPGGPVTDNIHFKVSADGKALAWARDAVEMFQVTANVPTGAKEVVVEFTQADSSGSAHLARVDWNELIWYPASPSDKLSIKASLIVPDGWSSACALPSVAKSGRYDFEAASLTRLLDSPAQIGRYYKQYDVTGNSKVKHYLDVMADTAEKVEIEPKIQRQVARLHEEMEAITGATHYKEYHWLMTLSNSGAFAGLEHHESSEDGTGLNGLSTETNDTADLLGHEYFHSYNGKFRRPEGLCTPDYQKPMKDELLWVYEGMTQFMGQILACRAGWWTPEQWREQMALNYVEMNTHQGREWRPLVDTAVGIPATNFGDNGPKWSSARRTQDYYVEMTIVWLEVDMKMRELSGGKKSIYDFQRIFHGGPSRGPELKPYSFDDVVNTLNSVVPYDWAGLLRQRVYELQSQLSQRGFELAGWKLIYSDEPNIMQGQGFMGGGSLNLLNSVGMTVGSGGAISDVVPGTAADKAMLAPGMTILTVNGEKYTGDLLKAATQKGGIIHLTAAYKGDERAIDVSYAGGLRNPHLVRIEGTTDRFADLLASASKP